MNTQELAARNRAVVRMTGLTLLSRLTGFARVIVVAAVLGTSYLGNVYQSSNAIPNILFELFAAGVLQSVLVPIMVDAVDRHRLADAEETAGAVLGAMLTLLGALVAAGMVAGPLIMRLLVSGVEDAAVRDAQVALGSFLLWFFLPQILFYAANLVATAVLNARNSFVLPVFAPTVNNVVVIATYLLFGAMRGDQPPSLDLTLAQKLVLALGTTAGVVAFCAVPVIGLWRSGFHLRPKVQFRHPVLRRLAREGAWAAGFLGMAQLLLMVVLFLSNSVEGGVVVYQLAFVLFMLPNSLFAVPVFTTAFPAMTRAAREGEWPDFAGEVSRASRSIGLLTMVSAAALVALSGPLAELVARGNASARSSEIGGAIAAFALGVPAYSCMLFLTRVSYAYGDTPMPTIANLLVTVVGAAAMSLGAAAVDADHKITAIGLGFSLGQTIGAVVLALWVRHRLRREGAVVHAIGVPLARSLVAALAGGVAGWFVSDTIMGAGSGSMWALVSVTAGGVCLVVVALAVQWVLAGPSPATTLRTLGSATGRGAK